MKESGISKEEVSSALIWKYSERITTQIVSLIVQIILARCIEPSRFGELAILLVFVNYATLFVQSGISTYIIQKENLEDDDVSSVLFITMLMALIMYLIIYIAAPLIARFYESDIISSTLRVISLSLFPGALCSIYQGLLSREFKFKAIFVRSLIAVPFSGIISVIMALNGLGLWALVFQLIINQTLTAIVMIIGTQRLFFPRLSLNRAKSILLFGGNVLVQSLLVQFLESIRTLIIGKKYSSGELAFYDKGQTYTNYLYSGISMTLSSVLLPTLTKVQADKKEMKRIAKRFLSVSMFIVVPLLVIFAGTSDNWVPILLTSKWNPAIPFIYIFSIVKLTGAIVTVNTQIYYALGQVKMTRRLITIESIISLITIVVTFGISTTAIAVGCIIISLIDVALFATPNGKNIEYPIFEQLMDVIPSLLLSLIMFLTIKVTGLLKIMPFLRLGLQIVCGGVVYFAVAYVTHNKSLQFLLNYLTEIKKR